MRQAHRRGLIVAIAVIYAAIIDAVFCVATNTTPPSMWYTGRWAFEIVMTAFVMAWVVEDMRT